ncbi:MAG: ATP-binding protein [Oscillospiraceae bacterium]|nr:ATP-binding protein [Oscillospiraceae bacterium]
MKKKPKTKDIKKPIRLLFIQLAFVWLSFLLMIALTWYFVSDMERESLHKQAEERLSFVSAKFEHYLKESEYVLSGFSFPMRIILEYNVNLDLVKDYLAASMDEYRELNFERDYGIAIYLSESDIFMTDGTWTPPEDFDVESRPWYKAAIEAKGDIALTPPYFGARLNSDMITAYSRAFYDEDGELEAVLMISVPFDEMVDYVVSSSFHEDGFGFALDADLNVIAHPNHELLGLPLESLGDGMASLGADLRAGAPVLERNVDNSYGVDSIVYVNRIVNDWYIGLVTPSEAFYRDVGLLSEFLFSLAVLFALSLSLVLWRVNKAKELAEKHNEIMLDFTPLGVTLWNSNFEPVGCNREAVKLFGLSNKQEYMKRFHEFLPESQRSGELQKSIQKCLSSELENAFCCLDEWVYRTPDGEALPCEITLVKADGGIVVGYARDLREQKQMLKEIERIEIAEKSNEAKSKFLAMMSHEIRTPMNVIMGIIEMLVQDDSLPQNIVDSFKNIYNSAHVLLRIINDILDLSKIEAGKLEISPVKYDTASLVLDTAQFNFMNMDSKPIEFILSVDEKLPAEMYGDEIRIKQIMNNLLSNAFKYTEKGEVVLSISAENTEEAFEADGHAVLILKVSDTGQGMTQEQIEEMYDEYSRFNVETNRVIQGTGLGMNITQNLIQLMRGVLKVESELGKGSVFTVSLPQKTAGSAVIGKKAAENLCNFRTTDDAVLKKTKIRREAMPYGKVLIVDDVATNLFVAKGLMTPYMLQVDTASSGFEAIDKISGGNVYDVIFMDHMMPKMDGIETVKKLRDSGYSRPIVALTANALVGQSAMFLENGFDEFISKPIDIRLLDSVLNRLVRDKATKDGAESRQEVSVSTDARQLEIVFMQDAKAIAKVLDEICKKNGNLESSDMRSFIINIHSIKAALAYIGESGLSGVAFRLERAGREEDFEIIINELPQFLAELREVMEKVKARLKQNSEKEPGYKGFLYDRLREIKRACNDFDKRTAKKALAELNDKLWHADIEKQLDKISEELLHSDFDEIDKIIEHIFDASENEGS